MSNSTLIEPAMSEPAMSREVYENPLIGDKVVFLKTSRATGGEYTLMELEVAAGGGNALHTHKTAAETFTVLEGNLEVQAGKERRTLKAGESFTVKPQIAHCFRNPSQQSIKFLVEFRPGHEGFENSLKIAYGLATDGLTNKDSIPKNFSHLALLSTMSDTYPTGIFSLLTPLLKWKAQKARTQGIEQELVNRYCR